MIDGSLVYCFYCLRNKEKIPEKYYDSIELYFEGETEDDEESIGDFVIVSDYLMNDGKNFLLICEKKDIYSKEIPLIIIEKISNGDDTIGYIFVDDDKINEKLIEDFNNHRRLKCIKR
jgi:hypothetical protein